MNTQLFRFTLYTIIAYLALSAPKPAGAASQPSGVNETLFCGVIDDQWNKRYSDQYTNRRYTRASTANLNVGEPRTVRMIYLLPNDRPYRADVVQRMKDEIIKVQTFFADQIGIHGYGEVPFRIETDSQGEPMVLRVDGGHPDSHYLDNTEGTVLDEINLAFNLEANVCLIVIDNSINGIDLGANRRAGGVGNRLGKNGGFALVSGEFGFELTAHELGHAFGLQHDFHDGAYIMSYGPGQQDRVSACHAEYLSVHPYFNLNTPTEVREGPTIELTSPRTYPVGSHSVPVRLKVNDSEGLHQVLLFVSTIEPHFAAGSYEVKACRGLAGDRDTVVQFDYDGVIPSDGFTNLSDPAIHPISVHAVDTDGDISYASFWLEEISPHHIATFDEHTSAVHSVAFSPVDAILLATGSGDGTVKLWNVVTQQNIATLLRPAGSSMAFSSDGVTLATGSWDGTVKLWDVVTQQDIATFKVHTEAITSMAFSSDGVTLATGSWDGTVKLWDVVSQRDIATFKVPEEITSMAFSSDGVTLATGSWDGTVKLWDVETERDIATLGHGDPVLSVAFSSDGAILASGSHDRTVRLWDVATRQNIATFEEHASRVTSVAFSSDGSTLATGSWDRTVKLWDITTGINFATLGHGDPVLSVAFSSDDTTLATGTEGSTVELWDTSGLMGVRLEAASEVDIPDPSLRAAIAEAIGLPPSTSIFRGHLENLTRLDARNADISDLTGLEGATNLRILNLSAEYVEAENRWINSNSVSDLSPLTGLTNLTNLTLWDNNISDISSVSGLTNLRTLDLGSNSVSDISSVAGLTNLKDLNVGNNSISDISSVSGLTNLTWLDLGSNSVSDISSVAGLTNLKDLILWDNNISDISPVSGLTNLTTLILSGNNISDLSPLVANTGLGEGYIVDVWGNPLSYTSIHTHIPALQSRGVTVHFDNQAHPALLKISGDNQRRTPGETLANPFVVEARDENGLVLAGISVRFTVTSGDGMLSIQSTTTDANGRAESTLTLGPNLGTHTVLVSAVGIEVPATFNAEGNRIPKTLEIISGVDQEGLPGDALEKAFVVEVRDQSDKPFPGVEVTFSVASGDGTLSEVSVTTDSNGRAESTLTLGPNPGTNTVEATVTGIEEKRTFTAEGNRIPKTLQIISGKDQEGLPGTTLEKPFVVEVRDQTDKPLPGVEVTFTVTAGGGTVQPEIATTDENGRAESTLTLGSTPGTNTVRVSVEGNTQAVATLTIETVRVFALSIPAGTHLIHIPLAVNQINGEDATIETVGDLYNALGDEVNFIITVGDDGGWKTYLGDISTGTVADAAIEDDTGLIVVMSDAKTLELVGDALGTDSASMISIDVGNNLVGVPLEPDDMSMISDLLVDGVGAIAVSKADGMGFHTIREPGQDGDGPIVGGVGYLVVYIGTEATSIPIVGSAWENSGAVSAAPAVAFDGTHTPVLYVEGGVMDEFNMLARVPELRVTVKNLSTGASLDTVLGTELSATAYSGTFVELSRHAAKAGDVLEIVAHAPNPFVGVRPVPQIVVSAEEVLTSRIKLPDLELYEIPSETELLANYPNPFNPETWIPYRLAKAAEVTIEIYDTNGSLVRSIDVGFKPAAVYESRASAIYWDGRNNYGERVASGVYFYHLSAGAYSATRKMLIMK